MSYHTKSSVAVTERHRELIEEFQALIAKYPEAEGKFVLAHLPEGPREPRPDAAAHGPIVWECEATEFGLDCRPVILAE
ncbi:hypothetical protein [Nocardia blacklockiae]|uniref:hypothetical protein n=1 Tax=Nocardia blacklockiae TaxID=480036 RepID=UPI001895E52A|nr:hypothetical protein [Nocardia blacklockiae]MBF6175233.1 hypothetical protein [Nocardia blacklockiae]